MINHRESEICLSAAADRALIHNEVGSAVIEVRRQQMCCYNRAYAERKNSVRDEITGDIVFL